jgi:hypothetical protein
MASRLERSGGSVKRTGKRRKIEAKTTITKTERKIKAEKRK